MANSAVSLALNFQEEDALDSRSSLRIHRAAVKLWPNRLSSEHRRKPFRFLASTKETGMMHPMPSTLHVS